MDAIRNSEYITVQLPDSSRRRLLTTWGAVGATTFAGCLGDETDGERTDGDSPADGDGDETEAEPGENLAAGDWPMIGYDARNTYAPAERSGPSTAVEHHWTYDPDESIAHPPIVVDGTGFVGASDGTCHALDLERGEREWTYESRSGGGLRAPAGTADAVFVSGTTTEAFDPTDGETLWVREDLGLRELRVADGLLYGRVDDRILALDATTGDTELAFAAPDTVSDYAVGGDERVYAQYEVWSDDDRLVALEDGADDPVWTYRYDGAKADSIAVRDGTVYTYDMFDSFKLIGIDGESGAVSKLGRIAGWHVLDAATVTDDAVFTSVAYGGDAVTKADRETGATPEEYALDVDTPAGVRRPVATDDTIYIWGEPDSTSMGPTDTDRAYGVVAIDAETGDERWSHPSVEDDGTASFTEPIVLEHLVLWTNENALVALADSELTGD